MIRGDAGAVSSLLAQPVPDLPSSTGTRGSARRTPDQPDYEASVRTAKEHIRAGDAFQIVLSQRAERPTSASALELYRALRRVNPSPYLFLLELDGLALIGSSPETLVKCEGRRAGVNPIAGTTERGDGDAERLLAIREGSSRARNARRPGPQRSLACLRAGHRRGREVPRGRALFPRTHLVSQVAGDLRDGIRRSTCSAHVSRRERCRCAEGARDAADLGARGRRRGPYAGAVGYALPSGGHARHVHRDPDDRPRDGVAHLQAGAGIVADSEPAAEHEECLRKLAAVEAAIDLAEAEQR